MAGEIASFDPFFDAVQRLRKKLGCALVEIQSPGSVYGGRRPLWVLAERDGMAKNIMRGSLGVAAISLREPSEWPSLKEAKREISARGFLPCRIIILGQGWHILSVALLGCQKKKPGRPVCPSEEIHESFRPLRDFLCERRKFIVRAIKASFLCEVINSLDCAAFITLADHRPLFFNATAAKLRRPPDWMGDVAWRGDGAWKRIALRSGREHYFLVLSRNGSTPLEAADRSDWAVRLGLSPRLSRVAALLIRGLTDKEIASRLGLSHQTVRTYVKELFTQTQTHTRHGFVAKALGALP